MGGGRGEGKWEGNGGRGQGVEGDRGRETMRTKLFHLHCMTEVAICGVLDANGGHSGTGVGNGTGNCPGGIWITT